MATNLIIFFLYLVAVVYFAGFALTNSSTQARIKEVFLYSGTLAMIGCISEVAINSFCRAAFHSSLWTYQVTPIHQGDTSVFAFFQWSLYGYHLYYVQQKLRSFKFKHEEYIFAFVLSIDALLLEAFVNISSLFFLNTFIFYYTPGDMGHLTTVFVFPFYLLGGAILIGIFNRFLKDPLFFGTLSFSVAFIFVFL
ncbi:MAG: hypothetical protein M0Q44_04215 [Methylobacter sp.]|jgi:hypothetical protein|nr:hypothetical protein [Methylobacter sp.]